jgi:helix-turn-helix protein
MKEILVKIQHNNEWIVIKMGIAEDRIVLPAPVSKEIPFRTMIDVSEKKNILIITAKTDTYSVYKILSVEKVLQVLKKFILISCNAYRLTVFFMSPAVRGGVKIKEAQWDKGNVIIVRSGIWFISAAKQVYIPLNDVSAIEITKRDSQGKSADVIKIDHLDSGEVLSSFVLCPPSNLQTLYNFLRDATKGMDIKEAGLSSVDQQVAMLVNSGMDSHTIENQLNISSKQLDTVYDRILKLGLGEVVSVRREIQLTPRGVRYLTDAAKSQKD